MTAFNSSFFVLKFASKRFEGSVATSSVDFDNATNTCREGERGVVTLSRGEPTH